MSKIRIMTDSHSGITQAQAKELGIDVLPMPFEVNGTSYLEDVTMSREEFMDNLKKGAKVNTSQPAPQVLMDAWDRVLKEYDQIIYIPISSGLSGSCATASSIAMDEPYVNRVFVVDNGRVATPMRRSVLDAIEMMKEGYEAAQIKESLEESRGNMAIYVAVDNLEYLKRGGRISSATAAVGSLLGIKPVLYFDTGLLGEHAKCRGMKKARKVMIEAMKHDFETRFKAFADQNEIYLLAASSASAKVTEDWVREIEEAFPGMEVSCDDLALAVSCHIGPDGLGIGCSCRPRRQ